MVIPNRAKLPKASSLRSAPPLFKPGFIHASNSGGALRRELAFGNLARFGIALYGCRPGPALELPFGISSPMTLTSRVQRLHELGAGEGVSYGYTHRATGGERVALVPIGYADGYSRALSNSGSMTIGGASCPVRGRVCMDQTVIGNVPEGVRVGNVVVVADSGRVGPSWESLSEAAGTIPYELLARLASRVPRYYVQESRVVARLNEDGSLESL